MSASELPTLKKAVIRLDRYLNKNKMRPIDLLRQLEERAGGTRSEGAYLSFITNCEGINSDPVFTVRKLREYLTRNKNSIRISSDEIQVLCQTLTAGSVGGKGHIDNSSLSRLMCLKQAPVSGMPMPRILRTLHSSKALAGPQHDERAGTAPASARRKESRGSATGADQAILAYLLEQNGGQTMGETGRNLLRRHGPMPQTMFQGMQNNGLQTGRSNNSNTAVVMPVQWKKRRNPTFNPAQLQAQISARSAKQSTGR